MFHYSPTLNWPDLVPALAETYLRKYDHYFDTYAARWQRLDTLGFMPADPGGEVYEAAESTVRSFYTDEQWFGDPPGVGAIRVYESSVGGQDWLDVPGRTASALAVVEEFRRLNGGDLPGPGNFHSTEEYICATWVVWRMHQMFVTEQALEAFRIVPENPQLGL